MPARPGEFPIFLSSEGTSSDSRCYLVTSNNEVTVDELIAVATGMRKASAAGCMHDIIGGKIARIVGSAWRDDYAYVPTGADDRAQLIRDVCGETTTIERGPCLSDLPESMIAELPAIAAGTRQPATISDTEPMRRLHVPASATERLIRSS